MSTTKFETKSREVHDGYYRYDITKEPKSKELVEIICPEHGAFIQRADHHKSGKGCPDLAHRGATRKLCYKQFLVRAKQIHGEKYTYEKEPSNFSGRFIMEITCHIHGGFHQGASKHLSGQGCIKCGNIRRTTSTEQFIDTCKKIHGERYDYSKCFYVRPSEKVAIICRIHGDWRVYPQNHRVGSGCPRCAHRISAQEVRWLDSLTIAKRQHLIRTEKMLHIVDGFDEITNTVYLYHGDYWHGNPARFPQSMMNTKCGMTMGELFQKTILKEEDLRRAGYGLVVEWETPIKVDCQTKL